MKVGDSKFFEMNGNKMLQSSLAASSSAFGNMQEPTWHFSTKQTYNENRIYGVMVYRVK